MFVNGQKEYLLSVESPPKITEKLSIFFVMKARHVMISISQSKSTLLFRAKNRDNQLVIADIAIQISIKINTYCLSIHREYS